MTGRVPIIAKWTIFDKVKHTNFMGIQTQIG